MFSKGTRITAGGIAMRLYHQAEDNFSWWAIDTRGRPHLVSFNLISGRSVWLIESR